MLKSNYPLASKISIVSTEDKALDLAINSRFYLKYSRFTLKALNKRAVKNFDGLANNSERIPVREIGIIRIEILLPKENTGFTIARASVIRIQRTKSRIYPTLQVLRLIQEESGQYLLVEYAQEISA
jgi:hypothetical protein